MSMPIHVKFPGTILPELEPGAMRYVLARDGLLLERSSGLFSTTTPLEGPILELAEHRPRCTLHCGKVPTALVRAMLGFFQVAYRIHQGEAALILLHHPDTGRFRWHCPEQKVEVYRSYGRLSAYDAVNFEIPLEVPDGYVILGDAHSHGELSAIPSYVDEKDEKYKDGLHLIVGRVHKPGRTEYHVDFVMDGHRFTLNAEDVLETTLHEHVGKAPLSWLERVRMEQYSSWYSKSSAKSWTAAAFANGHATNDDDDDRPRYSSSSSYGYSTGYASPYYAKEITDDRQSKQRDDPDTEKESRVRPD